MFQYYIRKVYLLIDEMRLDLTKSQERLQTLFKYMVSQHQIFKLQMQPQAVSGSDISISNVNSRNIFVSADLAPDLSADIDHVQVISRVFREPSNIDPHISLLQTQTRFVISLSCDLEPDITKPTSRNILVSSDMAPDMSAGINYGRVIAQVFREPFILNSSCHYFETFNKRRKISSQLWIRMAVDPNYISSRYIFRFSLVSLKMFEGRQPNNLLWLHMVGEFMSIFFTDTIIWKMFCFLTAENKPAFQKNVDMHGGRSHLYLLQVCIWLIFCFIDIHDFLIIITGVTKRTAFVYFITFKYIYNIKSVYFVPKPKAIISHNWCDILVLYSTYFCM